jgi:cell division transport system permease protein
METSKTDKSKIKMAVKVCKFAALALLSAFCFLVASHYCYTRNYAAALFKHLNVIVFFDKSSKDDAATVEKIEATGLVRMKEYVNSAEAYLKAVEKNPFLKDISVPDSAKAIQSYAVLAPDFIPVESVLLEMKNTLKNIPGVDEIIVDIPVFERYVKVKNLLSSYQKIFIIFEIAVFILFIFKCAFFTVEYESNSRSLVLSILLNFLSSAFGFFVLWFLCICMHWPLLIDGGAVLSMASFVAFIGVILN